CPTYSLWHEEMDSPRGRIYLMDGLVQGTIPLTDTVVEHFDRCLGCMACVTACPSGVQYDRLIEQTHAHIEVNHRRRPTERLVRGGVNSATPPALPPERFDVHVPRAQGCCGALHAHAGRLAEGIARAGELVGALDGYDYIVTNAAGCGSHLKDHGVANIVDV